MGVLSSLTAEHSSAVVIRPDSFEQGSSFSKAM